MKRSKYAFIVKKDSTFILYNCWNETLVAIEEPLKELFEQESVDKIAEVHPQFYDYLVKKEFILSNETNEYKEVVDRWKQMDTDESVLNITVNPTMNCNMRCWYCYEKHDKEAIISDELISAIIKLVEHKNEKSKLKDLCLSFFGGEPLLTFNRAVLPLLTKIKKLCNKHCISFSTNFVTNGYLLTNKNIDKLLELHLEKPICFQITLDGNEKNHNDVRHTATGTGSYAEIVSNLKNALRHNMLVILRFNCTIKNIKSYIDVLSDLKDLSIEDKKLLVIDLQHVWQDIIFSKSEFELAQNEIRTIYRNEGFNVKELKHIDISRCYADKDNHFVINHNGDLYNCTAREFNSENKEGILSKNGELEWNEKKTMRTAIKYGNEACSICSIYPLCHGDCSQHKLESQSKTYCVRDYSEEYKTKIVEDRVDYLLETLV